MARNTDGTPLSGVCEIQAISACAGRNDFSLDPACADCRWKEGTYRSITHKERGMSIHSAAKRLVVRSAGRLLALGVLWSASATLTHAQPTPAQILNIRPKCEDVAITTPAPADIAACKLDIVKTAGGGSGFVLKDGNGNTLRRFMDVTGGGKVDQYSYFKDGAEVYRESMTKAGFVIRWIGAGGMKAGVAQQAAGGKIRIGAWQMISAEEAAYEAFVALTTGDAERLQAVLISPQEIAALGLPAADAAKLTTQVQGAAAKMTAVRAKIAQIETAKFARLEGGQPGAYPTDITGGSNELIKIARGMILYDNPTAKKQNDFINAPEMIQVGLAWRLTDAPSLEGVDPVPPKYGDALERLAEFEKTPTPANGPKAIEWHVAHVKLVTEVAANAPATERDNWYRQVIDGLASATSLNDADSVAMLSKWKQHFATNQPTGNLAGYATYREIWALYQQKASDRKIAGNPKLIQGAQEEYHKALKEFVIAYSKSEDAPDALIQLAMGAEFNSKDDEAKNYYKQIVENFPGHANRPKADGAVRRLDSVGKAFELTSPVLGNSAQRFSMNQAAGKVAIVYYWSTLSAQAVGDFAALKKLQDDYAKDLTVICVSLDDDATTAAPFAAKNASFATHVHQPGGMNGPLATQYGIFGLPQVFLVDATGKVVSNKLQINMLDDEIAKLVKK
jgi:tetratricopeptide (TPR) repeat protein